MVSLDGTALVWHLSGPGEFSFAFMDSVSIMILSSSITDISAKV